jgi:hypothetical protein
MNEKMLALSERLLQLANDEGTAQIHDVAIEIAAALAHCSAVRVKDMSADRLRCRQELEAQYNDLLALQDQTDTIPLSKALDISELALSFIDAAPQPADSAPEVECKTPRACQYHGCKGDCTAARSSAPVGSVREAIETERAARSSAPAGMREALEECLSTMGWAKYTDDEMREEARVGNGKAPIILRARAALRAVAHAAPDLAAITEAHELITASIDTMRLFGMDIPIELHKAARILYHASQDQKEKAK